MLEFLNNCFAVDFSENIQCLLQDSTFSLAADRDWKLLMLYVAIAISRTVVTGHNATGNCNEPKESMED